MSKSAHSFMIALLVGTATASCFIANPGQAQSVPTPADQSTADKSGTLQDIVVTAQRREQRLQNVPIAITALTAGALKTAGVTGTDSLAMAVPGLEIATQQTSISPFIRGLGNRTAAAGDEAAVPIYVDGVYIASLAGSVFSLANIARIEVLKGPQGTLFGRNAAAGAIQIITRNPSHDASAEASLGYGNYNTVTGQFYGTAGITHNLAADLSVYEMNQGDGWGKNLFTGHDEFKGHELALRTKWLLEAGARTDVTFSADYDNNVPVTQPGFRALPGQLLVGGVGYPGFYNVNENVDVTGVTKQWGSSLKIDHDLDWARAVSITSYRDVVLHSVFDQDGTPASIVAATFNQYSKTVSQELQLQSPKRSKVEWIVGGFFLHDKSGLNPLVIMQGTNALQRFADQTTRSFAGYAQATAEIVDATKLTVGLRFTSDRRGISGHDLLNGAPSTVTLPKSQTFDKVTWHFGLDHKFSDDILGYVSYSRGFKSGVYSTGSPAANAVRPEVIDAYEVGLKSELLDRHLRLNLSGYYQKFTDIQLQALVHNIPVLINAASGDVKGGEAEILLIPVKNFQLNASLSYVDGSYTSFPGAPAYLPLPTGGASLTSINAAGKRLIYSSPFTGNLGAQYKIPTAIGNFDLNGSFYYNDGFYFDPANQTHQNSYTLLNASIGWTSKNGGIGISVYGRNLGGTHYYSAIVPQTFGNTATPAAPRTYGVTLNAKIG